MNDQNMKVIDRLANEIGKKLFGDYVTVKNVGDIVAVLNHYVEEVEKRMPKRPYYISNSILSGKREMYDSIMQALHGEEPSVSSSWQPNVSSDTIEKPYRYTNDQLDKIVDLVKGKEKPNLEGKSGQILHETSGWIDPPLKPKLPENFEDASPIDNKYLAMKINAILNYLKEIK